MKKVIINGQALNEVEIKTAACAVGEVDCVFNVHGCSHPDFAAAGSFCGNQFCNSPSRIFIRDEQIPEFIAGRLKGGV
jgi:hypothetical protein